jgi:4'-phosphopantetheinyl transferase
MFSPLPDRLAVPDRQVDAWILRVCPGMEAAHWEEMLSSDELAKGRRFHFQKDRDLSWNARAALRILLGKYLGVPAGKIRFDYTSRGRPVLAAGHAGGIEFSVSHSGERVAIALSKGAVGVDLELSGREIDVALLSQYVSLSNVSEAERQSAFLRHWTRIEAYLKATGIGLSADAPSLPDDSWEFFDLTDQEYAMAIAAHRPCVECRSRWLEWSGGELRAQECVRVFPTD